jgi:hypothetical protein
LAGKEVILLTQKTHDESEVIGTHDWVNSDHSGKGKNIYGRHCDKSFSKEKVAGKLHNKKQGNKGMRQTMG